MAGSSMTFAYHDLGAIRKIIATWTSDDAAGTASGTTEKIVGTLIKGITDPSGTAAPTDNYDIALTDEQSFNVLTGAADDLADRDTANTEEVYFDQADHERFPVVADKITIAVTAAGNSKQGVLTLYYRAA